MNFFYVYPPDTWNHYQSALDGTHKTNNVSEAWHNRFAVVVGKHHPDIYSALTELQKEQGDTGSMVAELSISKKVRASPKRKWVELQERIQSVARKYNEYKAKNDVYTYLRTLSYNVNIS